MVLANPPLAEPVTDPGGVINKPPFEMGVANLKRKDGENGERTVQSKGQAVKNMGHRL